MMKTTALCAMLLLSLTACKKEIPAASAAPNAAVSNAAGPSLVAPPVDVAQPGVAGLPDVGTIEQLAVNASGMGPTPGAALNDALKTAVMQVNGTTVQASSTTLQTFSKLTAELDLESPYGKDSATLTANIHGSHFADRIVSQSQGVVSSFKVTTMTAPKDKDGMFAVDIAATIAKFKAPADSGKIKIVVAPLRSDKSSFNIGGRSVPAATVLAQLRQQLIDSLTQSGRFTVLDRQFEGELEGELNLITSGQARNQDFAKLGQALTADLVWIGVVNELAYTRHARALQTSDRELVSYSGGWSLSHRMINLSTRQILQSGTIDGRLPSIAPTTLSRGIDTGAVLNDMRLAIAKRSAEAILLQTFPISVVERDGINVVLSQGGNALTQGMRYRLYLQGKELKDPQTGQSLGFTETACCDVLVSRVTPKVSYGVLENVAIDLDRVVAGAVQVREMVIAVPAASATPETAKAATPAVAAKSGAGNRSPKKQAIAAGEKPDEDKDW